jgi:uncharacterized glyoxalase superfamily protein PhnB
MEQAMPQNPPANMPRIAANIYYDDPAAALEWLAKSFGFETRMSIPAEGGGVMHAEMTVADSMIMMSPTADNDAWQSPGSIGGATTMSLYIYIDDVDAHCAQARSAGAEIVSELEDMFWGDRTYVVRDLEGHRWTFAQAVKDPPENMGPPA